ncbi:uncharacterized protein [Hyperolius riggenbachi]|uniref:uncharacterized protein n=1 Tax=Hyperolius riggenbachi TaxID=752182 RepID=UPI0035A30183
MQSRLQLTEIKPFRNCRGYHCKGKLLSINEIGFYLQSNHKSLKTVGKTMSKNIESVCGDLSLRLPVEFPVMNLQHVTDSTSAKDILKTKSFKGREDHERPEFKDLSFWSVSISSDDIERGRQEAYNSVQHVRDAGRFQSEIKEQFANSPAFDESASRYGNFRFSFPLEQLMEKYRMQHCEGEEPQLRILGTDVYKQEIAHYIVVHSPHADQFNHCPKVLTVQRRTGHLPIVFWMDGRLYWRPESTCRSLKLKISEGGCKVRPSVTPRSAKSQPWRKKRAYEPRCVWNGLVFTFHLPNGGGLSLPVQSLLGSLSPCDSLQPFLGQTPMQKHEAREIIRKLRKKFRGDSGV